MPQPADDRARPPGPCCNRLNPVKRSAANPVHKMPSTPWSWSTSYQTGAVSRSSVADTGSITGRRVHFTHREAPWPRTATALMQEFAELFARLDERLDEQGVPEGQPFLIDPEGRFDGALNRYFSVWMAHSPWNTQAAHARDLRTFFICLWSARGGCGWRGGALGADGGVQGRAEAGGEVAAARLLPAVAERGPVRVRRRRDATGAVRGGGRRGTRRSPTPWSVRGCGCRSSPP